MKGQIVQMVSKWLKGRVLCGWKGSVLRPFPGDRGRWKGSWLLWGAALPCRERLGPSGCPGCGRGLFPGSGLAPFALAGVPIGHLTSNFVGCREDMPGRHEKGEPTLMGTQRQTGNTILSPREPSNWVSISRRVFV